ncbi:hypothetical protein [uncultured Muriicola sp.]|uniref:hypothetical protein n=1 Tax=uncultured Muriicola sp. TaxID=1583102 RepID=UPI002609A41F|nr:hypothetical protein [uncultured Muriicola sp.]
MKHIKDTLFYDGSFNGFLTLLYEVQARNLTLESIQKTQDQQEVLFIDCISHSLVRNRILNGNYFNSTSNLQEM